VLNVRPSKSIRDLPVESVLKKVKDQAFARSVDRRYVYGGVGAVGRSLEEHTAFIIEALKPVAEVGLQGVSPPSA
jgi:predicted hydrolase (HD superfamily)